MNPIRARILYSLISILVAFCLAFTAGGTFSAGAGGGGAGDTCGTGGLLFSWHCEDADVTQGTPTGCSSGDTTGTLENGAAISNAVSVDGSNSVAFLTSYDRASFSSSGMFDSTKGRYEGYYYTTSVAAYHYLFSVRVDAYNYIRLLTYGTGDVSLQYNATGQGDACTATTDGASMQNNTWYRITAYWTTSDENPNLYVSVCDVNGANCTEASSNTNILEHTGTLGDFRMGDTAGIAYGFYLDKIKVWDTTTP